MIPIQVPVCLNRVENAHVSSCIVGLLTATIRSGSIPEISACCHPANELNTAAFVSLLFYHGVYFDTHCMLAFRQAPRVEALSCKFPNLNSLILAQTVASLGVVHTFLQHSLELNNAQRSIEHLAPATIPQTSPPRSCHTQKTFFHTLSFTLPHKERKLRVCNADMRLPDAMCDAASSSFYCAAVVSGMQSIGSCAGLTKAQQVRAKFSYFMIFPPLPAL